VLKYTEKSDCWRRPAKSG